VGSHDKYLYAINADGTDAWSFPTGGAISSSPAIGSDGTIYVGSNDNKLYAIDWDKGTQEWAYETGGAITSSPAIANDETIFVGSNDRNLYAITPTGIRLWVSIAPDNAITSSPAIGADGFIYFGSDDTKLYAVNPNNGIAKWSFSTEGPVKSSPAIVADGTAGIIYVGSEDKKLYAVSCAAIGLENSPWPMFHTDLRHTGLSTSSPPSEAPEVTTLPATSKTGDTAVLNGTVNPNGYDTTYYFEYGNTAEYGSKTEEKSAGLGTDDVSVSDQITGLTTDETYQFRLVATNEKGTTNGYNSTFTAKKDSGGGCFLSTVASGF